MSWLLEKIAALVFIWVLFIIIGLVALLGGIAKQVFNEGKLQEGIEEEDEEEDAFRGLL